MARKLPRPMDAKLLPGWAKQSYPNDTVAQKREIAAGQQAIRQAQEAAKRQGAYEAMKAENLRAARAKRSR